MLLKSDKAGIIRPQQFRGQPLNEALPSIYVNVH